MAFCLRCWLSGFWPSFGVDVGLELDLLLVEVDPVDEAGEGIGAHAALEVVAVAVGELAPEHLVLDDLARVQLLELVEGALEQVELALVLLADDGDVLLGLLGAALDLGVLGAFVLERLDLALELLVALGDLELALLLDGLPLGGELGLDVGQVLVELVVIDPGDEVGREVDDLLELLGLELLAGLGAREEVGEPRAGAAQVPDVDDGRGELDVAHALAPDLGAGHLDAAALADDALEPDALVLAAGALEVLLRTEDLLAEQAVLLRLERAVVDGLGLLDLTVGPHADGFRGGQTDAELVEVVDVQHVIHDLPGLRGEPEGGKRSAPSVSGDST